MDAPMLTDEFEAELPQYIEGRYQVARPLAEHECSIAKWAEGDGVKATQIATRVCEDRYDLLRLAEMQIAAVEAEVAEHEAKIAALRAHQELVRRQVERRLRWLDGLLAQYQLDFFESQRTKAGNLRTTLPYGVEIVRTVNKPKRVWVDEEAALQWQYQNAPDEVRVKYEPDKRKILKRLAERPDGSFVDPATGEVVDFVRLEPPEEPESVEVKQELPPSEVRS